MGTTSSEVICCNFARYSPAPAISLLGVFKWERKKQSKMQNILYSELLFVYRCMVCL